jgi:hypothetical protein
MADRLFRFIGGCQQIPQAIPLPGTASNNLVSPLTSGVRHSNRHLFEVRFPPSFSGGNQAAETRDRAGKDVPQGLNRLRKDLFWKETGSAVPQIFRAQRGFSPGVNAFSLSVSTTATRPNALNLLPGYSGGFKNPPPRTYTPDQSFSAACLGPTYFSFVARLKSCPDTKPGLPRLVEPSLGEKNAARINDEIVDALHQQAARYGAGGWDRVVTRHGPEGSCSALKGGITYEKCEVF